MQQDYTIPDLNKASGFWMVFILLEKNFIGYLNSSYISQTL